MNSQSPDVARFGCKQPKQPERENTIYQRLKIDGDGNITILDEDIYYEKF